MTMAMPDSIRVAVSNTFPESKLTQDEIMRRLAIVAHSVDCGDDPGYGFRWLMVKANRCSICCLDYGICGCA